MVLRQWTGRGPATGGTASRWLMVEVLFTVTSHLLVFAACLYMLAFIVPSFEDVYREERVHPSVLTQWVISASSFARQHGVVLAPLLLCADLGVYSWLRLSARSEFASRVWSAAVLIILLVGIVVIACRLDGLSVSIELL